jgi:signal transduction histidine kinase/FixJ family two-component response regulator
MERTKMEKLSRVLVIDDNPDFLFAIETFLKRKGYEVWTARDGKSGVSLCQNESPGIVITDFRLPGIDGIEVLKSIKKADPEKEVIIVTGHGDMQVAVRALQLGATDLLTKPINYESLLVALERAEERYSSRRELFDLLPCYVTIQDRSFKILETNQTFENDFGDGVGKKCYTAYKGGTEMCPSCPLTKTFEDKKVHLSEQTVRLANGDTAQMIVYSAPILDAFGNVTTAMEVSTNISKVKEMQEELALLGQSMAILSHEIKNILEGLQGGAYVVDEGLKDGDPELTKKGWGIVRKNIGEVSNLVQNILYSSKKRRPTYERVYPKEIVSEVVGIFLEKANSMKIHLEQEVQSNLPQVNLDASGIRRMLTNLISNALEACERDRQKDSHTVVVRADFHDQLHFMFEVEDNGTGMDENTRENSFREFYSTKGIDGTGLGLLVVNEIVKAHGGRMEILSSPGKGSTFRVILELR